jgi:hypothetical protein
MGVIVVSDKHVINATALLAREFSLAGMKRSAAAIC